MRFPSPLACVPVLACAASLTAACSGPAEVPDPGELITTVTLTLTPPGGTPIMASFDDPDGDGGAPPVIDPITLVAGTTYATSVRFLNMLETPPEDITTEVADEADQHQVFFTGTAVNGPASNQPGAPLTHAYADRDVNDLPIGLASTITATAAGSGTLIITLRHLPPLDAAPTKTSELDAQVQAGGFSAIAGGTDAQVTFPVTVP
ncbi:MAG: hypothetical protein H0X17_20585 [Deltaproteobacteria bacterium]|nr:hypothetical protein [Deltaproteobacteria bacterium]